MKAKPLFTCVIWLLFLATVASAQEPKQEINVAPNAPKDKVVNSKGSEVQQFEAAIKPFVEQARKTYPEAKERFLKGLPPRHTFFVTARLYDSAKRYEQVFIAVKEIKDGRIKGLIWSDIQLAAGYRKGDAYTFPESELVDWTISKPDGTEEGNFVGKFLESYQPQTSAEPAVWHNKPVTPERVSERIEAAAIKYQADAPILRAVFYDIGYPHNDREAAALDGHAVILITALAQERAELPLKRVYVLADSKEIELKLIKQALSEQSPDNPSAKTFGAFRADSLYLLPISLRMKNADLMVDFAANKTGSKAATFGSPVSADVSRLTIKEPTGAAISDTALDDFIKREYPSFFQQ
jgi:hypothetical protein